MSEHTPTTEQVRDWYVLADPAGCRSRREYVAEFDRWLEQVKAEAWHGGYDAGLLARPLPTRDEIAMAMYKVLDPQYGDFCIPDDAADAVLDLLIGDKTSD